jgi:hypothetical protein
MSPSVSTASATGDPKIRERSYPLPGRNVGPRRQCPLRSLRSNGLPVSGHPGLGPSHEVGCPSEYFCRRRSEPSGSLAPTAASAVSGRPSWCSVRLRPPPFDGTGSSSRGLASSPEFQPHRPARRAHATGTFHGVSFLLRDVSARSPLPGRGPALPTFRPQCFAHSRRLAPPRTLPACFIRLPRPRFPLQGFLPGDQPHELVARRFPLAVGAARLRPSCLDRASSFRLDFRALLRSPIRCLWPAG